MTEERDQCENGFGFAKLTVCNLFVHCDRGRSGSMTIDVMMMLVIVASYQFEKVAWNNDVYDEQITDDQIDQV